MRTLRYASAGLLLGVGWGVVARVWMRLISTDPSFSWLGTSQLVGMAGIGGALLGLAEAARRRGGRRWWRLVFLYVAFLFSGAGLPLLPAVAIGGWGLRRGVVGRLIAAVGLLSAPVILVAMTWQEVETWLTPYPENIYRLVLGLGGLVLAATAAWGASVALGPWRDREPASAETSMAAAVGV